MRKLAVGRSYKMFNSVTYDNCSGGSDHRLRRTGHLVCSAINKPQIGRLVVGCGITNEPRLIYYLASTRGLLLPF